MELELEGLINDYCYRQTVRLAVKRTRCYADVNLSQIIAYVYPIAESSRPDPVTLTEAEWLVARLQRDIRMEFIDFSDWAWAKSYKLTIVDRVKNPAR
jgi:hypothetical protein